MKFIQMPLLALDVQKNLKNFKSRLKWMFCALCFFPGPTDGYVFVAFCGSFQTQVVMLYFGLWAAAHSLPSPLTATTEIPVGSYAPFDLYL